MNEHIENLDLDQAFVVFQQSYQKATGKAWDRDKFIERAQNWEFFGDNTGFLTVRPQKSGLIKLVGVAGHPKGIIKGINELQSKYGNKPIWGMVSLELAKMAEKKGMKVLRVENNIKNKLLFSFFSKVIPASVFGDAKILGLNNDGTLKFQYGDIGETDKILIGNTHYFDSLIKLIQSNDKLPEMVKSGLINLIKNQILTEDISGGVQSNVPAPRMCAWCQKEFNLDATKLPKNTSHGVCRRHAVETYVAGGIPREDAIRIVSNAKTDPCIDLSTRPDIVNAFKRS
jgi:hypothetical protein